MSIIKDTFFGGAEKNAAKATQKGIERGIDVIEKSTKQAREDLFKLFPAAQQNLQQGFQGALDVFGQSLPAQTDVFQQGNVGAQQQLITGLQQQQNALFGNQVDMSQLQPFQVQQPDLGFFNQTLPQLTPQATPETTNANMNGGLGPFNPNNPAFNNQMGPFQDSLVGGARPNNHRFSQVR